MNLPLLRQINKLLGVLVFGLFISKPVEANNFHDHLVYLPSADDWTSIEVGSIVHALRGKKLGELLHPSKLAGAVYRHFNVSDSREPDFQQLCMKIGNGNFISGLTKILSLPGSGSEALSDFEGNRELYLANASLRYSLFHLLDGHDVVHVFHHYFKRLRGDYNRNSLRSGVVVIDATVYWQDLVSDEANSLTLKKLRSLMTVALNLGIDLNYFMGISRLEFLSGQLKAILNDTITDERLTSQMTDTALRLLDGIDIVGSIFEGGEDDIGTSSESILRVLTRLQTDGWIKSVPQGFTGADLHAPLSSEYVKGRLIELAEFAALNSLQIRLHAFEATNQGAFYDGLRLFVQTYGPGAHPIVLRIGHIATLTEEWIEILTSPENGLGISPIQVAFEISPASNQILFGTSMEQQANLLTLLATGGHSVLIGSDGHGIIPGSGYHDQLEALTRAGGCRLPLERLGPRPVLPGQSWF